MSTTEPSCVLTAQPQNLTSYQLVIVDRDAAGQIIHTEQLLAQDGSRLDSTSWTIPADQIDEVWWASRNGDGRTAADFYDVMPVVACRFTVAYQASPGWRDSVTIAPAAVDQPAVTTTTAPEPPAMETYATTPLPPADQPPADQQTPTPSTANPSTTIVVEVPTPTPPAPATSTTVLEQPGVPVLPATGYDPTVAVVGALLLAAGALALAGQRRVGIRWETRS